MFFSKRSLNHIKFLEEYILLILDLKTEIKYRQKPLTEIFAEYGKNKFLSPIISDLTNSLKETDFEIAWKKSFSNLKKLYALSDEEESIIKNFASKFGASGVESQINYCDYNISLIKPHLQKATENKSKNQKLPIILGLSLSLVISIALI